MDVKSTKGAHSYPRSFQDWLNATILLYKETTRNNKSLASHSPWHPDDAEEAFITLVILRHLQEASSPIAQMLVQP